MSKRAPRRPRFRAFLLTGAILGLVVAAFLDRAGPDVPNYSGRSVFGLLGLAFAAIGALLAAVVAVLLDRDR